MTARMAEMKAEFHFARQTLREQGLRAGLRSLSRKYGWKLVAAIVIYYLIRDVTLYILLPFLISRHLGWF